MKTTSIVLSDEQFEVLKKLAAKEMMEGKAATASVSARLRKLIDDNMPAFLRELEER